MDRLYERKVRSMGFEEDVCYFTFKLISRGLAALPDPLCLRFALNTLCTLHCNVVGSV
jgi:hypothetical protein